MFSILMRLCKVTGIAVLWLLINQLCYAQDPQKPSFEEYVEQLKVESIEKGFSDTFVTKVFSGVEFYKRAVKADKNQPERKITLDSYLASRVPDWKVSQAVQYYQQHKKLLDEVGEIYGVQPRFIVALWGNESNFGRIQGNFPVVSALTTLAYEGRREALFKKQLFAAMNILKEGHIEQDKFVGSWAGAMGQSQFMPTSFLTYAVDFDGDGKKDIWSNPADVFASIANYLKSEGWNASYTWGRQVKISKGFDLGLSGLSKSKMQSLKRWQELGVTRFDGSDLPKVDLPASLIMPDGENGRIYLVYSNFHTLMRWNRSTYFGVSVSYLADRIKKGN